MCEGQSHDRLPGVHSPPLQTVVGVSNTQPVLLLSNLIDGTYNFTLTVTNKNQQRSTDTVLLTVLANPHDKCIVEVSGH